MQENSKNINTQITNPPETNHWKNHVKAVIMLQSLYRGHVARLLARKLRAAAVRFC